MKLLAFTLILALSGTEAFAMNGDSIRTEIICEEGYKFLVVYSSIRNTSPTVTQILETAFDASLPPQPMKCN